MRTSMSRMAVLHGNGVYVVARVHGRVLADEYFTDDGDARAYFERYTLATEWAGALRLAPAEWEIAGTQESALDEVLASAGVVASLERRPVPRWWLVLASMAVVATAGGSAVALWPNPPVRVKSVPSYEAVPRVLVPFASTVAGCDAAAAKVFQAHAVPGWDVTVWRCEGGRVRTTVERAKGMPRAWGLRDSCLNPTDSLDSGTCDVAVLQAEAMPIDAEEFWNERDAGRHVRIVALFKAASDLQRMTIRRPKHHAVRARPKVFSHGVFPLDVERVTGVDPRWRHTGNGLHWSTPGRKGGGRGCRPGVPTASSPTRRAGRVRGWVRLAAGRGRRG